MHESKSKPGPSPDKSGSLQGSLVGRPSAETSGCVASAPRCSQQSRLRPDGRTLLSAGVDGTIRLWDRNGKEVHRLRGHSGFFSSSAITGAAFSSAMAGEQSPPVLTRRFAYGTWSAARSSDASAGPLERCLL